MKTSERTQVLEFLKRHVIGKAVVAKAITTHTDNDLLTTAYEEDAVYSNLVESAHGFSFDLTTLARGTRYRAGNQLLAEGTMNTVYVIRYEMTERLSSGHLVGHSRMIASTNTQPDPFAGTIFLVRMSLNDNTLEMDERQIGYADVVTAAGTFRPIATEGKYNYAIEDDRLVVRYQQATFEVDPETLERTPTGDRFPIQVSHEIVFPPDLS